MCRIMLGSSAGAAPPTYYVVAVFVMVVVQLDINMHPFQQVTYAIDYNSSDAAYVCGPLTRPYFAALSTEEDKIEVSFYHVAQ